MQLKKWDQVVSICEQVEAIDSKLASIPALALKEADKKKTALRKGRGLYSSNRFDEAKAEFDKFATDDECAKWSKLVDQSIQKLKEKEKQVYQKMFG